MTPEGIIVYRLAAWASRPSHRHRRKPPRLPKGGEWQDPMCPARLSHHVGVRCSTCGGTR